MRSLVRGLNS